MTYLIILNVVLVVLVCWTAYKSGNDKTYILTQHERLLAEFIDHKEKTEKDIRNVWTTEREIEECLNNTAQALIEYVQMNNAIQKDLAESISLLAAGKEKTVH